MNFKIGDWVVIDELVNRDRGVVGHVFQVAHINKSFDDEELTYLEPTKETTNTGGQWNAEGCRYATLAEIPKGNKATDIMRYKEWLNKQAKQETCKEPY